MSNPVHFILTGLAPTGGVRATFALADALRTEGVDARVVIQSTSRWKQLRQVFSPRRKLPGWFVEGSQSVTSSDIMGGDFPWCDSDLVVAVGTFSIQLLRKVAPPGRLVHFCHGFADHIPEVTAQTWGGDVPTVAVCDALLDRLRLLGATNVRGVVPNGLDPGFIDANPGCRLDSRLGVGTVYSDHPIKRPAVITSTLSQLRSMCPEAELVGFGAKPYPDRDLPITYTVGAGVEDAISSYLQSRVWFLASFNEGFGLPMIEAMACGAMVVSGDFPAARELLQDSARGRLFPVSDPDRLAHEVVEAFRDTSAFVDGFASRVAFARSFTWERAAAEFIRLLM